MPARKPAAKKAPARKAPAKKAPARKPAAKKTPTKKTAARKPTVKKAPAKKTATRKSPAKKTAAKKAPPRKPSASRAQTSRSNTAKKTSSIEHTFVVPVGMYCYLLDVPYEDRQTASWAKARWQKDLRTWVYLAPKGTPLPERLRPYAAPRHSWEAWREAELNGETPAASGSGDIVLHQHQVEAADVVETAWNAGRPGVLIADEVGLGKTFSALAGVNRIADPKRVLILCPLSVVPHWRRSIDALGSHHRFTVINYDRAKKLLAIPETAHDAKRTRTKNKRIATKGVSIVDWDVIIADEAHLLKNPTSQRSAAVRQLQGGRKATSFMVWCSATAGQNPTELAYTNRLIAAKTGVKLGADLEDFEAWCKDLGIKVSKSFGGLKWTPNDADLDKMHELLFSDGFTAIRRRPTDIAGWPELERILHPVELSASERSLYEDAWSFVKATVKEDQRLRASGETPHRGAADPKNPLVALLRFRQAASRIRLPYTVALAEDLLANGKQVAISAEFRDTVDALLETLAKKRVTVTEIHGGLSPQEREENRLQFQQGKAQVIVFTVKEGISLHQGEKASNATDVPRATIIHDGRWDALSTAQIEGRTWRDGQFSTCYHTFAEDTVEQKVVKTMLGKLEAMKTMLADSDLADVTALLDSLVD